MRVKDTLFYITGAASGLGAATAELLHAKGAYVALFDINLDAAQALAERLNARAASEKDAQEQGQGQGQDQQQGLSSNSAGPASRATSTGSAPGTRASLASLGSSGASKPGARQSRSRARSGSRSSGSSAAAAPASSSSAATGSSSPAPRALAAQVDVVSEEEVQAAIELCDRTWPHVVPGGVLNAGGVGMAGKTINQDGEPFDLDTYRKVVEINLIGTFNVSRLVAARLVRDAAKPIPKPGEKTVDRGVIINTASAAALEGQAGQAAYSASKGGVLAMTLPMARDLAWYGIRVMTLAPALFSTAMTDSMPDRAKAKILQSAEFPVRFGRPDEFAHACLAIIENEMMNGSYIRLDGATRLGKL